MSSACIPLFFFSFLARSLCLLVWSPTFLLTSSPRLLCFLFFLFLFTYLQILFSLIILFFFVFPPCPHVWLDRSRGTIAVELPRGGVSRGLVKQTAASCSARDESVCEGERERAEGGRKRSKKARFGLLLAWAEISLSRCIHIHHPNSSLRRRRRRAVHQDGRSGAPASRPGLRILG